MKRQKKQRLDSSDDIINVKNEPNEECDLDKLNDHAMRAHYKEQRYENKQKDYLESPQKSVQKEQAEIL